MTSYDPEYVLSGIFREEVEMKNESPPVEDDGHSRESGIIQWKEYSGVKEIESKLLIMRCEIDELHKSKHLLGTSCIPISPSYYLIATLLNA